MSLRVERLGHANQLLAADRNKWNALSARSPMQSADWLLPWWVHFQQPARDELCVLLVYDHECLIAVAPWYVRRSWGTHRCLRFLGDGLVCSDHASLLIEPGFESKAIEAISDWLIRSAASQWDAIHFEAIDELEASVAALVKQLQSRGCDPMVRNVTASWSVSLPDDWEGYLRSLSKNHRKRCRRWQRTYFDTGRARVHSHSVDSLPAAWDRLANLNRARRAQLGDRSAFEDERFSRFHLDVLAELLPLKMAALRELYVDGQSCAMEYVLYQGKTVFCYQSGIESSDNRDGLGNLSLVSLFRDAIERGYRRLDFLRGDEAYKTHWGAQQDPCIDYRLAAPSISGRAHLTYQRTVGFVRELRNALITPAASAGD